MFFLLVLLTGLGGLHAGYNPHKTFVQTTIPEKISSVDTRRDPENNVAYIITLKGRPYFVHLKKQSFLSSASVVYSYDKYGVQHSQSLLPQMDCSYSGYVTGFPHSLVALMTCSGLRGVLQFKNISYRIEPLEAVSGFIHMIYEENNDNTPVPLFGENDSYARDNDVGNQVRSHVHKTELSKLFPRYIEMYIVVDKNLFDHMGSDIKTVTQKVIELIGLVNTMLTQLKLTVLISSIEIWSSTNKITITGHPDDILFRLLEWKRQRTGLKQHHISYLLVFENHPTSIGATFPRNICNNNYASGVALYPVGLSLESYAVIIVQLLGLNVGLVYDNTDACYCSADICTMTPKAVYSGGLKDFSTCSLDSFKSFASHGLSCLKNSPQHMPVYKQAKPKRICGNSVREEGEECDCGTALNCTHKKCCDATTCRKKPNVKCGSGACCTTSCQIKKANVICRPAVDKECDFNEYCNGEEADCAPDTYAHNGYSCDSGGAFCFGGLCRTHDKQCQALIGGDSRGAPYACFEEINSMSDSYGNCGKHQCNIRHALCGKLVCMWPHKQLVSRPNLSVIYTHVRNDICVTTSKTVRKIIRTVSLSTYLEPSDRDETFVEDGTICGPGQFCDKWACKEVQYIINKSCDPARHCSNNGICNNFQRCHCFKGFYPPECQIRKGEFGSIDDGHVIKPAKSNLRAEHAVPSKQSFQLIFYIGIPVLIIAAAILITQNKLRKLYCRGEKEYESSVSEDSSRSVTFTSTESKSPAYTKSNAEGEDAQKPSEVA